MEPTFGYVIHFDIAAFVICAVTFAVILLRRDYKKPENRWMIAVLVNSMFSVIFDILSAYSIDYPSVFSHDWAYAFTYLYYFLHATQPVILFMFSYYFIGGDAATLKKRQKLVMLPYLIIIALMIVQLPTSFVFSVSEGTNAYSTGIGYYIVSVLGIFYIAASALMFNKKTAVAYNRRILMPVIAIIAVLSMCVHFFLPKYLLELFIQSVLFLMITILVEGSENLYDQRRKVYNYLGFRNDVKYLFKKKNPVSSMIVIKNPEITGITSRYGKAVSEELIGEMIDTINEIAPNSIMYNLENGKIVLTHRDFAKTNIVDDYKALKSRFEEPWNVDKYTFNLKSNVVLVNIPEDFHLEDQLTQFVERYDGFESMGDVKRNVAVGKALLRALDNDSFFMTYQPLYNVNTGKFDRAEALVRLIDDDLGFIPPDEFVKVAEQDGLMLDLGESVLNNVMRFVHENDVRSLGIEKVNINLSPTQCSSKGFSAHLKDLIDKYGIDPSLLCFEVTETMEFNDTVSIKYLIRDLHEMKSSIALDDFGTGYSNLVNIIGLGFDEIKIDKSILWNANQENHGDILIAQIIGMVKQVEKEVVVEGVETMEQLDKLKQLGCSHCQGFLFSKPLPGNEFVQFVQKKN
ncbi:MAG: EAL domain-containing protein [Clostridiales bacterium]|nr:EAL domain-containing protein [Clostridiales bacterium]